MKKLVFLPIVALSVVACNAGAHTTAKTTKPTATQSAPAKTKEIKAKGVWIDVRSPEEYNAGHLGGAVNIVHTDIASQIAKVAPNKDEPINLYCKSGRRAEVARQELIKLGYTNVTNHGGYEDLVKKGLK